MPREELRPVLHQFDLDLDLLVRFCSILSSFRCFVSIKPLDFMAQNRPFILLVNETIMGNDKHTRQSMTFNGDLIWNCQA